MALVQVGCEICSEDYDSQNHRPLCLDCGHTFCELCIQNLGLGSSRICPTCRKLTNKSTDQLAVVFALIPSQEGTTAPSNLIDDVEDKCNDHGCVLDRFCAECGEMVCRKCLKDSHAAHRGELINDILHKDPDAATLTRELENKIDSNIKSLSKSISESTKICKLIDEISKCKKGVEDWTDTLSSQKKLAEQLLKDWNEGRNKCTAEQRQIFKELCHQWKEVVLPPGPIVELTSLTNKLKKLNKRATHLQELMQKPENALNRKGLSNASEEVFRTFRHWTVESDEHAQAAISSRRKRQRALGITIVSSPKAPIQNFPKVLNALGSASLGQNVSVKPLDTFWAPSSTTDSSDLQAFIKKFGLHIALFYGSPDEVVTLCRVNPGNLTIGVRLASMADVNQSSTLSKKRNSCSGLPGANGVLLSCPQPVIRFVVCCIQSLPAAAGDRIRKLGWKPHGWHFPDAKAGCVDWMISLMEPLMDATNKYAKPSICLPRCSLNENDFRVLLKKYSECNFSIYCEHLSLPASVKSDLELIARNYGGKISIQWSIPLKDT